MIVVTEGNCGYSKTVFKCHSTNLACFFILEYNLHLLDFLRTEKGRPSRAAAGLNSILTSSLFVFHISSSRTPTALLRASQTKQEPRLIRKQIKSKTIRQPSF